MKLKLGENLRRLRKEQGLTQEQFADALGVSFQAVSRWENGTAYPDMSDEQIRSLVRECQMYGE